VRPGRTSNATRIGAIALFIVAFIFYLVFSKALPWSPKEYEIKAVFENASTLSKNSPVRIAGVNVGKVTSLGRKGNAAEVTFTVNEAGQPIHDDATVRIRPRLFLEGNLFLDVKPGSPSAPELKSGGTIPITRTATAVQLDEVLTSLQSGSRENLRAVLQGFGTALNKRPTPAEDKGQDDDVRGRTGGESINQAFRYGGRAGKGSAIVTEALQGEEPHDLSIMLAAQNKAFTALLSREAELKDLITNFSITVGALASESENLSESVRQLAPTLRNARSAFFHLNQAFPPLRAIARDLRPGVREIPGTIAAARPWLRQANPLLSNAELGEIAADLKNATPGLARAVSASIRPSGGLLNQVGLVSRCASEVLVPAGNVVIDNAGGTYPITTGQPNIRELFYSFVNIAGESQSFDGNGQYVRFQAGGGPQLTRMAKPGGSFQDNEVFANMAFAPLGTRPRLPTQKPPYRPDFPCDQNPVPDINGAPVGPPSPQAVP
jgi:phospholipid/cholesterol/gamma-HCH transport system substrate-binding protein